MPTTRFRLDLVLGLVFGLWNLTATRLDPLAEDTIPALLVFWGPDGARVKASGFESLSA